MVNVFRELKRTGNATRPYPFAPERAPDGFRGQLRIDTAKCEGHGRCADVCPSAAIAVEHHDSGWTWMLADSRCVACGLCVEACPVSALHFSPEFERAARRAGDLVTRISFERKSETR